MRRIRVILLCLWVVASSFAATYQCYQPTSDFHSTSAYRTNSQSSMSNYQSPTTNMATGSLSAISASNFNALNSEGGLCYAASAKSSPFRAGKKPDTPPIGQIEEESPIGEIPFILMAILASLYVIWTKKRKKVQKNLVVS